jgi:predicted Holliday junction resolvase-like endonuclease
MKYFLLLVLSFLTFNLYATESDILSLQKSVKYNKELLNTALAEKKMATELLEKATQKVKQVEADLMRSEIALHNANTPQNVTKKSAKSTSKIGTSEDDVPCNCVFNKNRMWNPEKIVWNNEEWQCAHYKEDGTCERVQKVYNSSVE